MGYISKRSVEEIYDAIDIVEIIGKYVELKQTGSTFRGLSPFSNEKTPSFYVIPQKDIWKDFSSGKGGSAVNFIMEQEKFTYPEALRHIASIYHITIVEEESTNEVDNNIQENIERFEKCLLACQRIFRNELDADTRAREFLESRGITQDDIVTWQLGYGGNEWRTIASSATEKGYWTEVTEMGVCGHKGDNTFDLYRHRITIPIYDDRHKLVGFGGRLIVIDPEKKIAKYINTRDTKIYSKSKVLFGLERAKRTIIQQNCVLLVEGYLDVIALHRADVCNVVASCGTALTADQAKLIKRFAKNVIIIRDGDAAGLKAADRDVDVLVSAGLDAKVIVMPEGEDPDDYVREGKAIADLLNTAEDAIIWRLLRDIGDQPSPDALQAAIQRFCETLLMRSQATYHNHYIDLAAKAVKQINKAALRKDFKRIIDELEQRRKKTMETNTEERWNWLPEGIDRDFVDEHGFFKLRNRYWFMNKTTNEPFEGTNFIINPLYHIHNKKDDKRLFELVREDRRALLEVPSTYINQKSLFENVLAETPGNFYFTAEFTQYHFRKLMIFLGGEMPTAFPLNTLGQQDEGFFAFADGIAAPDGYTPIDNHGMVSYSWEKTKEDGEFEKMERHFYLPAFSDANRDSRSDSDEYENERKLQFRKSKCTLSEYFKLFMSAYGKEKGIQGIAFLIASAYRDIFMEQFRYFPLLFCWGEKGSGKSAFSINIQNFFYYQQEPFMLNAGTDVGFFRRLARVTNAVNFFDEYTDNIDEGRFQALKASWEGVGREKGVMSRDNRTEITKVRSSLIVAGQYVSTRDDHSLTSRSILLEWQKQDVIGDDQRKAFNKLTEYVSEGISSLICELITHRRFVQAEIAKELVKAKMKFREATADKNVMERIVNNYAVLQAHVNLLHDRLKLPFDREDLFELCRKGILYTNEQIIDSEALSTFWEALAVLVEERMIKINHHFKIEHQPTVSVFVDGHRQDFENLHNDQLLFIRPGFVYSKYVEYMHKQRIPPLSKNALQSYMRGRKKLWIGDQDTCRFGNDVRDRAWVVNYSALQRMGYSISQVVDNEGDGYKPAAAPNPYEKPDKSDPDSLPF